MKNPYHVLGVSRTATATECKAAFRKLATVWHPDKNPGNKDAEEKFKDASEAYELLVDVDRRKRYDSLGSTTPITVQSKTTVYQVEEFIGTGDSSKLYRAGDRVLKVCCSEADNTLLQNEASKLKICFKDESKYSKQMLYYPRLYESFKLRDGGIREVNVLEYLRNYHTLKSVRNAYPSGVRFEHSVWMFNRILEALQFLHRKCDIVHGAVVPDHVMVYASEREIDPLNHGARLVGYGASVKTGETLKIIASSSDDFYPPEVFNKKPATSATDIYMAAKCCIYVLGGDVKTNVLPASVPNYLAGFLRGCLFENPSARPNDAWELHEELTDLMARKYGPKKYFRFDMPSQ